MIMNKIAESAKFLQGKLKHKPKIGIVLGSGLGIYVDQIQNKTIIPYQDIPHFKKTAVEGHEGILIAGDVHGVLSLLFKAVCTLMKVTLWMRSFIP